MRLGQLARKYDVSLQEIISYLNEIDPSQDQEAFHQNSKLDEQLELMVVEYFDVKLDVSKDPQEVAEEEDFGNSKVIPTVLETEINEETEVKLQMELDPSLPPIKILESSTKTEELPKKEHEVIETDKLIELLDDEESEVDLSKITLIKAPKRELDGLKVVGKIDLPEPKTKTADNTEEQEEVPRSDRKDKNQQPNLDAEEKEARRLKFKDRREKYDAQQAKLEKEKRNKENKALKKARYEQNVRPAKPIKAKKIDLIIEEKESIEIIAQRPLPKTIFGKFWRWLDASSS